MSQAPRVVIGTTLKEQISTSFFAHIPALVDAGWDVHLICAPGPWPARQPPADVTVHEIDMLKTISPRDDLRALTQWVTLLRELQPEVVIGGSPKGALLAMVAGRMAGVPRRIHLHRGARWETLTGTARSVTRAADRLTAKAATDVVAVSHSLAQLLHSTGITRERPLVLANGGSKGVDLQRFHPEEAADAQRGPDARQGPVTLGFVGRLSADKGLEAALAALDGVRNVHAEASLVVVGDVDPADPPTDEVIERLANDPHVDWQSWRNDVPAVIRQFDVLVFPSAREGLPNAVIEAAASGVPAVGWDVTGVRDAIRDGYSGLLVSPGDLPAFAAATVQLVDAVRSPDSRWSEQAREWATRFDQQKVTQAWLDLVANPALKRASAEPAPVSGDTIPTDGHPGTPKRHELAVVVVTYRSAASIEDCVASLAAHAPGSHVVIVDNSGQAEAVREAIRSRLPHSAEIFASLQIVDAPGNIGYARGVNLGVALLPNDPRYLLILNPDVAVSADPLELVPGLERADVTSGHLLGELPNVNRATTYSSELLRGVAGVRFRYVDVPLGSGDVYVPQLAGAYLLQTLAYYRNNPLDERFELYYEDVDYCDRARAHRGVLLQDRVVGSHVGGMSSGRVNEVPYVAGRVSRARYLRRRYPQAPELLLKIPFTVEYAVRSVTRQAEGAQARGRAWRAARAELHDPGTVRVLEDYPT